MLTREGSIGLRYEPPHIDVYLDGSVTGPQGYPLQCAKYPLDENHPDWARMAAEIAARVERTEATMSVLNFIASLGNEAYGENVQANNLADTANGINPDSPIANLGTTSSEIGGVGIQVGIIKGLKDSLAEVADSEHLFFLQTTDNQLPFQKNVLQQIIRELAVAIFVHNKRPWFSLHFNKEGHLYPVIPPEYERTMVGRVMGMLDYMMKGYLNGGIFSEDFVDEWLHRTNKSTKNDAHRLVDPRDHDSQYRSLREIMMLQGLRDEQGNELKFTSSFRIIADSPIVRNGNAFLMGTDFRVGYTIEGGPDFNQYVTRYRAEHGAFPDNYVRLQRAYAIMAEAIHEKMPRLPMCREYFNLLGVIHFFSHYFSTLREMNRVPALAPLESAAVEPFPQLLPPLPIRDLKMEPLKVSWADLCNQLTPAQVKELETYVRSAVSSTSTEAQLPLTIQQPFERAWLTCLQGQGADPEPYRMPGVLPGLANHSVRKLVMILRELIPSRHDPEVKKLLDHPLSNSTVLAELTLEVPAARSTLSFPSDDESEESRRTGRFVVGGCGIRFASKEPTEWLAGELYLSQAAPILGGAPDEELIQLEHGGQRYTAFKLSIGSLSSARGNGVKWLDMLLLPPGSPVAISGVQDVLAAMDDGAVARVEELLVNAPDCARWRGMRGQTLLHHAAHKGNALILRSLLAAGVDPLAQDQDGFGALHVASACGQNDAVATICDLAPGSVALKNRNGSDALYVATQHGQIEVVKTLLQAGASPNCVLTTGMTTLHAAIHHGQEAIVGLLVGAGADVHAALEDGTTPLHLAADFGCHTAYEFLLAKSAHCGLSRRDGMTPFSWPAPRGTRKSCRSV